MEAEHARIAINLQEFFFPWHVSRTIFHNILYAVTTNGVDLLISQKHSV